MQQIDLVSQGRARAQIVIAEGAVPVERHAAEELRKYIAEMSGAQLPVTLAPSGEGPNIYIGTAAPQDAVEFGEDALGFDGYAVGGLAVGEGQEQMFAVLDYAPELLPRDRPRYLMGVGKPDDLVGAVARGIDMFDCVLPTRSGRTGQAFTHDGPINIKNARFAEDRGPIDGDCRCAVCETFERAYLHHLVRSGEILGAMLMTEHNLSFYQQLMAGMRAAIEEARFGTFAAEFTTRYGRTKNGTG